MGNCCIERKNENTDQRYRYKILSTDDAYLFLRHNSVYCTLCKDGICHAYISMVYCNYCRVVIGHEECFTKTNKGCPLCKHILVS